MVAKYLQYVGIVLISYDLWACLSKLSISLFALKQRNGTDACSREACV